MKERVIPGRVWVLVDESGRLIENVDTDQIFHNAHLHITDATKMGQYALGNLEGWQDFPSKARPGDIVIAGRNFGAGSSRQQAVDCFIALGAAAVLAPSFSAIYFRNAVNSGFPVLKSPDLEQMVEHGKIKTDDLLEMDLEKGEGRLPEKELLFRMEPMSRVQREIYEAGDLFKFGRQIAAE